MAGEGEDEEQEEQEEQEAKEELKSLELIGYAPTDCSDMLANEESASLAPTLALSLFLDLLLQNASRILNYSVNWLLIYKQSPPAKQAPFVISNQQNESILVN